MSNQSESRRGFLKAVLTTTIAAEAADVARPVDIVAALGDVVIPTDGPEYPGYRRLEAHGISNRVLNQLRFVDHVSPADLALFNESTAKVTGRSFLESDAAGRASYLDTLFADPSADPAVQKVLKLARERILTMFYRNFPYDSIERDDHDVPIPNKPHEIFDFKKGDLVTGWDIAGYRGPLSWEEEEQRRSRFQKILWQ
jgi:hypothetical protein